jgi:hypothetical protein
MDMDFTIEFYETASGTCPVREFPAIFRLRGNEWAIGRKKLNEEKNQF